MLETDTPYDLIAEARKKFGDLSAAEAKVLNAVKVGEFAYCGPSPNDDDPGNDPAKADAWSKDRIIRAALLRWLLIEPAASRQVDPGGVRIHGATIGNLPIENGLDLQAVTIPLRLFFIHCKFEGPFRLVGASTKTLSLQGCRVMGLQADGLIVSGDVFLRNRFHADGEVRLNGATISGDLDLRNSTLLNRDGKALNADGIRVVGNVYLSEGFSAEGQVRMPGAEIGGQLSFLGAKLDASAIVDLENAHVKQAFLWRGLSPGNQVKLDLHHASVGPLHDDPQSWPAKGNLHLDGFLYQRLGTNSPAGANERLEWLARQPDGFVPQPYRQLAKVLREAGDDNGARDVLIAMENARLKHGKLATRQRIVQWILRCTVGYGYRPLRALWWIVIFVLLGTMLFSWGQTAGVITKTKDAPKQIEPFNPFIYSLENFLPLVDLKMTKYWLPDPNANATAPELPFLNYDVATPNALGSYLRWYLWLHILLGYFFTGMLVAGVAGIVRRE